LHRHIIDAPDSDRAVRKTSPALGGNPGILLNFQLPLFFRHDSSDDHPRMKAITGLKGHGYEARFD
jgi:hypothetical protein